jgi:hypothetical protein
VTADPARVGTWWRRWAGALIGVPTSAPSGLVMVDLDVKGERDGNAAFEALRAGRPLPDGSVVRTPSGGPHLYFRAVPPLPGRGRALRRGARRGRLRDRAALARRAGRPALPAVGHRSAPSGRAWTAATGRSAPRRGGGEPQRPVPPPRTPRSG